MEFSSSKPKKFLRFLFKVFFIFKKETCKAQKTKKNYFEEISSIFLKKKKKFLVFEEISYIFLKKKKKFLVFWDDG